MHQKKKPTLFLHKSDLIPSKPKRNTKLTKTHLHFHITKKLHSTDKITKIHFHLQWMNTCTQILHVKNNPNFIKKIKQMWDGSLQIKRTWVENQWDLSQHLASIFFFFYVCVLMCYSKDYPRLLGFVGFDFWFLRNEKRRKNNPITMTRLFLLYSFLKCMFLFLFPFSFGFVFALSLSIKDTVERDREKVCVCEFCFVSDSFCFYFLIFKKN